MANIDVRLLQSGDNVEAQLDSAISAVDLTIQVKAGEGALFPATITGTATSAGTNIQLNQTGIGALGLSPGDYIYNITDGSHAYVDVVSADSISTSALRGGTGNTWDNNDEWVVGEFEITLNKRNSETGVITAYENVKIRSRSGDILTVDPNGRGFAGTTAQPFLADDYVNIMVTSSQVAELRKAIGELAVDYAQEFHAPSHIRGGTDVIDGDKIDITWNPTNYTPDTTPPETDNVDELTAHLKGIDNFLAGVPSATRSFTLFEDMTVGDVVQVVDNSGPEIAKLDPLSVFLNSGDFTANFTTSISVEYDRNVDRIVMAYKDNDNSSFGTAIVGQVNADGTITFGTEAVFHSVVTSDTRMCFDSANNKIVIVYHNASTIRPFSVVATPTTGNTISFGTPVQIDATASSNRTELMGIEFDVNAGKVLATYGYISLSSNRAAVGTVSGTAISWGTPTTFSTQSVSHHTAITYDSNSQKLLVVANNNSGLVQSYVATITGTTVAFTSAVTVVTGSISSFVFGKDLAYDSNANAHLCVMYDNQDSKYKGVVGVISGGVVTWGTPADLSNATGSTQRICCEFNDNQNVIQVMQDYSTKHVFLSITVDGSNLTFKKSADLESTTQNNTPYCDMAFDPDRNYFINAHQRQLSSNVGGYQTTKAGPDGDPSVGVLQESGLDGEVKQVVLFGGISDIHSGLTIGETYYTQPNGTIATTETSFPMGVALSATEILTFK